MEWISLGINLLSGAVGGNAAGKLLKSFSLGKIGNSIAGIMGGGLGGQLLNMLGVNSTAVAATSGGQMDFASLLGALASGGVGGSIVMVVFGCIKKAFAKA